MGFYYPVVTRDYNMAIIAGYLLTNQYDDIKTIAFHHQKKGETLGVHGGTILVVSNQLKDDLFMDVCFVCSSLIDLPSHFHCFFLL